MFSLVPFCVGLRFFEALYPLGGPSGGPQKNGGRHRRDPGPANNSFNALINAKTDELCETARPINRKTDQPQNRKTAEPKNRRTEKPKTEKPQTESRSP